MLRQKKTTKKKLDGRKHILCNRRGSGKITEDTPLTSIEQAFITEYLKTGNIAVAMKEVDPTDRPSNNAYKNAGRNLLRHPNVQKEINRIMEELKKNSIASADEVMQYFTAVMRGEIRDQFGLDAPLTERTRAAQEIARRTIDIDNKVRLKQEGIDTTPIQINLNWDRN